jgi:hypothetical protein
VQNVHRSGRPRSVTDRDYRHLERTVKCNRRTSLADITSKFNEGRTKQVCKRTNQNHLHKYRFFKRVSKKRVIVSKVNRAKRLSWCREKRRSKVVGEWDLVIFSDESKVVIGSDNRV